MTKSPGSPGSGDRPAAPRPTLVDAHRTAVADGERVAPSASVAAPRQGSRPRSDRRRSRQMPGRLAARGSPHALAVRTRTQLGASPRPRPARRSPLARAGSSPRSTAARAEVDELRGVLRGRVWIGALLPASDLDIPGLLARFSDAHPGIEVGLREGMAADMLRHLADDELDAAFCLIAGEISDDVHRRAARRGGDRRRRSRPAARRRRAAGPSPSSPAQRDRRGCATARPSSPARAAASPTTGRPLHRALESGDPFLLRTLAARRLRARAILPRSFSRLDGPALEIRRPGSPPFSLPLALVSRRERDLSPAARAGHRARPPRDGV